MAATKEINARRYCIASTETKCVRLSPSRASAAVEVPSHHQPTRHAETTTALVKVAKLQNWQQNLTIWD